MDIPEYWGRVCLAHSHLVDLKVGYIRNFKVSETSRQRNSQLMRIHFRMITQVYEWAAKT